VRGEGGEGQRGEGSQELRFESFDPFGWQKAETGWSCKRKYCFAGLINSEMSGGPAGWSEKFRPANGTFLRVELPKWEFGNAIRHSAARSDPTVDVQWSPTMLSTV
jgi:hypothetical protein